MKLYVTTHSFEKIKESFMNLRSFYFIDVDQIIKSFNYRRSELTKTGIFIVNDKIKEKLASAAKSKRYEDIVYINNELDEESINNLNTFIEDFPVITESILIEEDDTNPNKFQKFFKEILFFPTGKKIKIYECTPIKSKMFYWINGLNFPSSIV
jgi:hypothetical protein